MICVKMLHSRMSTDMKLWTGNRGWMWSEQMYINMAKICFTSCSEGHVSSQQNKYHIRGFLQEFEVSLNFVPGLELFTIYVNSLWHNFNAFVHFYADDTIIYCAQNIKMVFKELQLAFDFIQSAVSAQTDFNCWKKPRSCCSQIETAYLQYLPLLYLLKTICVETVASYKYLQYCDW